MKEMSLWKKIGLIIMAILFGSSCAIGYIVKDDSTLPTVLFAALLDVFFFCLFVLGAWQIYNSQRVIHKSIISSDSWVIKIFDKNAWLKIFICLLILWIPFVIVRYPGIQSGGVISQFNQFMGMDSKARRLSPIIYDGHYITGHHPILLTYFFGIFIKIGIALGHPNIGMFSLACVICCINALGWSFVLYSIKKYIDSRIWIILFVCFGFNPMIISLNTYVLKDNLFATALAVYAILFFRIFHENGMDKKSRTALLFMSVLLPFVKNQGIYIVILTTIVLIFVERKKKKYWLCCLILPILCFQVLFQGIMMPALKIAPGGRQEMLSIFCQATARTINEHAEILDSEDYETIYNVFPIDDWTVYSSVNADAIKFQYNQNSSTEDLLNYLRVWLKQGREYPVTYLRAIFAHTYGYYYIDSTTRDWFWGSGKELRVSSDGDVISTPYFEGVCSAITDFLGFCTSSARIKYLFSIAAAFWIIVINCFLFRGNYNKLIWIIPIMLQWLICLVSPVSGSGRYGMVLYEMAPCVIAYVYASGLKEKGE